VTEDPAWLDWARRLAAVAQNGLEYERGPFEVARYTEVRRIAAEMLAAGGAGEVDAVLEVLHREQGYATPKVDVRAFALDALERVLLVRERSDGRWALPGGWADPGDGPAAAVAREVAEEAGYRARPTRLLACWDRSLQPGAPPYPFRVYKLFFACELLGTVPRDDTETDDVTWAPLDDLPPLSLGRGTPAQIARLADLARDPSRPAAFD
jgi:8-oxo-dGTP pyrophosphatase MutT (NUDIX family)